MRRPLLVASLSLGLACGAPAPAPEAPAAPVAPLLVAIASATPEPAPEPPPPPPPAPAAPACAPLALEPLPLTPAPPEVEAPLPPIEDDSGVALSRVYEKLAAIVRGKGKDHLRIGVYGDSNMVADWITGGMRRSFQERLGDAGHGFVALGKPWPGYVHMDVKHDLVKSSWMIFAVSTQPTMDRRYGFAGITVQSMGWGARTWIETAGPKSPIGQRVSKVGVHYLRGPKMGPFEVQIDGKSSVVIDTEASEFSAGHSLIEVEDAPHKVLFQSTTGKPVRFFGATMERGSPSVVVDSLGVGASNTETMLRQEPTIYREALANRGYDLIIFLHGTFDIVHWGGEEKHAAWVRRMMEIHRAALPGVSFLILSPPDRAPSANARQSNPKPAQAAREKRVIAKNNGAAFWDFRQAMGGELSIVRFYRKRMADADLIHFNARGGQHMGNRLAHAIWRDFMGYLDRHPQAGCEAPSAGSASAPPASAPPASAPPASAPPASAALGPALASPAPASASAAPPAAGAVSAGP